MPFLGTDLKTFIEVDLKMGWSPEMGHVEGRTADDAWRTLEWSDGVMTGGLRTALKLRFGDVAGVLGRWGE